MRHILVSLLSVVAFLGGVRLFSACVDVTPIVVENDAFDPDATCLLCLKQPEGCSDLFVACEADPRCKPVYACMEAQACLDLRTLDDKIKCGLPCAQEAGVASLDDPVVETYLVGLVACAQLKCAERCNLSDASVGL